MSPIAMERMLPEWPSTAALWKPGTSALSTVASVSPMRLPGLPPTGSEDQRDVVLRGPGPLGDDRSGVRRHLEGIGRRVVQVDGSSTHGQDSSDEERCRCATTLADARGLIRRERAQRHAAHGVVGWVGDHARDIRCHHRRRSRRLRGGAGGCAAGRQRHRHRAGRAGRRRGPHRLRSEQGAHRDRGLHVGLRGGQRARRAPDRPRGGCRGRRRGPAPDGQRADPGPGDGPEW